MALMMTVEDWLDTVAQVPSIRFVPVDVRISVHSVNLPGDFHKDPADRIIVATARHYSARAAVLGDCHAPSVSSISGRYGIDAAAPCRVTDIPASVAANRMASRTAIPLARPAEKPPMNASPAPVVSTH